MKRRDLLKLALALTGAKLLALTPAAATTSSQVNELFNRTDELGFIGRKCLGFLPANKHELAKLAGINNALDDVGLLQAFDTKRKNDFQNNRIHVVGGWVMAESECALCALIELS